jgi:kinesin family member 2/24
MLVKDRVN